MQSESDSNMKECLACHKKIGLFRRLASKRFCCQEHEETSWAELQKLAVMRLNQAVNGAGFDSDQAIVPSEAAANPQQHELLTPIPAGA